MQLKPALHSALDAPGVAQQAEPDCPHEQLGSAHAKQLSPLQSSPLPQVAHETPRDPHAGGVVPGRQMFPIQQP